MNQIKRQFIRILVILACALPWAAAEAEEKFHEAGIIGKVGYGGSSFTLHEKGSYTLAPGAEFRVHGNGARPSELKPGDFVVVVGRTRGDVNYVDQIVYHPLEAE